MIWCSTPGLGDQAEIQQQGWLCAQDGAGWDTNETECSGGQVAVLGVSAGPDCVAAPMHKLFLLFPECSTPHSSFILPPSVKVGCSQGRGNISVGVQDGAPRDGPASKDSGSLMPFFLSHRTDKSQESLLSLRSC